MRQDIRSEARTDHGGFRCAGEDDRGERGEARLVASFPLSQSRLLLISISNRLTFHTRDFFDMLLA